MNKVERDFISVEQVARIENCTIHDTDYGLTDSHGIVISDTTFLIVPKMPTLQKNRRSPKVNKAERAIVIFLIIAIVVALVLATRAVL
jgi:hypothetical protein